MPLILFIQTTNKSVMGKMLHVDVSNFTSSTWASPSDNPCIQNSSCFGNNDGTTLKEICAIGLHNLWWFSFDQVTGDMFIGNVG